MSPERESLLPVLKSLEKYTIHSPDSTERVKQIEPETEDFPDKDKWTDIDVDHDAEYLLKKEGENTSIRIEYKNMIDSGEKMTGRVVTEFVYNSKGELAQVRFKIGNGEPIIDEYISQEREFWNEDSYKVGLQSLKKGEIPASARFDGQSEVKHVMTHIYHSSLPEEDVEGQFAKLYYFRLYPERAKMTRLNSVKPWGFLRAPFHINAEEIASNSDSPENVKKLVKPNNTQFINEQSRPKT